MHKRTVWIPEVNVEIIVQIPDDRDDEEYIEDVFDEIMNEKYRFSDWDFVDGIS